MKKVLQVWLYAGMLLAAPLAWADDVAGQVGDRHPQHGFKEADSNGDGKVSHDEFQTARSKHADEHFKKMDSNGDGFVDEAEHKALKQQMKDKRMERRARRKDSQVNSVLPGQ